MGLHLRAALGALTAVAVAATPLVALAGGGDDPARLPAVAGGHPLAAQAPLEDDSARGVVLAGTRSDPGACGDALALDASFPGEPTTCLHFDVAPPGVDVREPLTTAEARARRGASALAVEAANELGVATAAEVAAGSTVRCDGDGTSGARVQAMYVVEAGKADRYDQLLPSLQQWAAGVDDVVNRSAALTGGVRSVRWVHGAGSGSCTPTVLRVTVPAGSNATFSGTVSAVRAAGYERADRKYLMWVDAAVLCGIAGMYYDERSGQDNANNGAYPQYARVDQQCWGSNGGHSVEAHELIHNLGGVQHGAPHSTRAGHCNDESDTMCYADGGSAGRMVQVCPPEHEYLLDCRSDDYFSTFPDPGSWLDTHWNSADSKFLIGGGDGVDGGAPGVPTRTSVSVALNGPAVPGLPTQATAELSLPEGRTAGVTWAVARRDCRVSDPTGTQTSITCPATATGSTVVTVTALDSTGATATARGTLAFATSSTRRPVTLAAAVDGSSPTYAGCTGAPALLSGVVRDAATGQPVLGLPVELRRRAGTATTTTLVRRLPSGADGAASALAPLSGPLAVSATSLAVGPYAAGASGSVSVTTTRCTADLAAAVDTTEPWKGDAVTVSGTLTRPGSDGAVLPVGGQSLSVVLAPATGRAVTAGRATTRPDGSYSVAVRPLVPGTVEVRQAASTGFTGAVSSPAALTPRTPSTLLTGSAADLDVLHRQRVVVTGSLRRVAGAEVPVASGSVVVEVVPATGRASTLAVARTTSTGTFSATVTPSVGGALRVRYAGSPAQPAATTALGDLVVRPWSTASTLSLGATRVAPGTRTTATGRLTVTGDGTAGPALGVPVKLVLTPASGSSPVVLATARPRADGTWSAYVAPRASGTVRAVVSGVPGHTDSASAGADLVVG